MDAVIFSLTEQVLIKIELLYYRSPNHKVLTSNGARSRQT